MNQPMSPEFGGACGAAGGGDGGGAGAGAGAGAVITTTGGGLEEP